MIVLELPIVGGGWGTHETLIAFHLPGWPQHPVRAMSVHRTYVRTRNTRWHVARSAIETEHVRCLRFYCGQAQRTPLVDGVPTKFLETDSIGDDEPLCGTCVGRALGAGHALGEVVIDTSIPLLFVPRYSVPPAICPGVELSRWWLNQYRYGHLTNQHNGVCHACGEPVKSRYGGGPYNGHEFYVSHPPGPNLVDPCPFHAWKKLGYDGKCTCSTEEKS